jgi:hypothetical protein
MEEMMNPVMKRRRKRRRDRMILRIRIWLAARLRWSGGENVMNEEVTVTEWSKCARCGMTVKGDYIEYEKHQLKGECATQLVYNLVQSVQRMEQNLRVVMEIIKGEEN